MRALWLGALVLAACGRPPTTPPEVEPKLKVISEPATRGSPLTQEMLPALGTVSAVGTSTAGNLVTVASDRVFELIAGELTRRSLYAEGSDPTSLGQVSAIIPRAKGGAWLAGANGLFVLEGSYVSHSPVMVGMGAVAGLSEVGAGGLDGLWLAATNGVYRRKTAETNRYTIEGYGEAATGIATDPEGTAGLAVLGGKLVLLTADRSGGAPLGAEPPEDVGTVNAVAAARGVLYAATSRGLFRWQAAATPPWSRFTLGEVAALDVEVDPVTGTAWVATDADLLRIDRDVVTSFTRPSGASGLTVDRIGDLWTANGSTLLRIKAGAGATDAKFAADLKPWLQQRCTSCHAEFADIVVFSPKAEAALQRVRTGDMPRCTGGVPCAKDAWLQPADYAVLEGWIRGGKQP